MSNSIEIITFGNETKRDKKLLKEFVAFHWKHYENEPQYVPLLDYEYLGFHLIGMTGFFEPQNLFFKHARVQFFLAYQNGEVVGRCNAFVNDNYMKHWKEKVGFFGQFECIEDEHVAKALLDAAEAWLKAQGMDKARGPQNLPYNEATPGFMTEGFDSQPVMYYAYNKPYYADLVEKIDYKLVQRVKSFQYEVNTPMPEKLDRLAERLIKRYDIKLEHWGDRPLKVRKQEMREMYNDAWGSNWGFVPFEEDEFSRIVDDMQLIMNKNLFVFCYIKDEPVAFLGCVPNCSEVMTPIPGLEKFELGRAVKLILNAQKTKGIRLGYLGVKHKYRKMGLAGVMLWWQKQYTQNHTHYEYSDLGWVLEDNTMMLRTIEMMGVKPSKTYSIYEKKL